jgi:O-antigen/teichoic acid export membrane protein
MYFIEYITKIVLLVVFLESLTLEKLLIVYILGYFLALIFGLIIVVIKAQYLHKKIFAKLDFQRVKLVLQRLLALTISGVIGLTILKVDEVLVSFLFSPEKLDIYTIPSSIVKQSTIASVPIVLGMIPLFKDRIPKKTLKISFFALLFTNLIIAFGFLCLSDFFVTNVYGSTFLESVRIFRIFAFLPLLWSLYFFSEEILIVRGKTKVVLKNSLIIIFTKLFLTSFVFFYSSLEILALTTIAVYLLWFVLDVISVKDLIITESKG